MSSWEVKWELYEVDYHGVVFKTCRDKITGLIACPICIHAASKCMGDRVPGSYTYENSFFYSLEDLILHIKNYHVGELKKRLEKIISQLSEEET